MAKISDSVFDENNRLIPAKLHEMFDLQGGKLFHKRNTRATRVGDEAGSIDKVRKQVMISFGSGRSITRARVIYTMFFNDDPGPRGVERLNTNTFDDRPENLIARPVRHLPDSLD